MSSNLKWGELVSDSRDIEVHNRPFWPRGPACFSCYAMPRELLTYSLHFKWI